MSLKTNKRKRIDVSELLETLSLQLKEQKVNQQDSDDTEDDGNDQEWEVSKIVGHRIVNEGEVDQTIQFEIKWKGYKDTTWEDEELCTNCEGLVSEYLHSVGIKTIYVYLRVSSKNQVGHNHVSFDSQEMAIRHAIYEHQQNGINLPDRIKIIKVCGSGYSRRIPVQFKMLCDVAKRGDFVYAYRADRLGRNVFGEYLHLFEQLNNREVKIFIACENRWFHQDPVQFAQHILDANKESSAISQRVRSSIEFRRQRGDMFGSPPFGKMAIREEKTNRRMFVDNPEERKVLSTILNSKHTDYEMALHLNRQGITNRGSQWSIATIRRLRERHGVSKNRVRRQRIESDSEEESEEEEEEDIDM